MTTGKRSSGPASIACSVSFGWLDPFGAFEEAIRSSLHPRVLIALGVGSAALFVLGVVGVPYVLTRLPADYFSRAESSDRGLAGRNRGPWRAALVVVKNIVGAILLVLGIAMFVLPGQGVLTVIVALGLLDFPGKHRLQRRLVSSAPILRTVNALRSRAGRPPLEMDAPTPPSSSRKK
jgi:hypothetical protein